MKFELNRSLAQNKQIGLKANSHHCPIMLHISSKYNYFTFNG